MVEKAYRIIDNILCENSIPHEIIFVDDGSKDLTWTNICSLHKKYNNVKGVRFSKNFGKEAAIHAGLYAAERGGCCVVIDCDLQHPPEKIVEMYRLWEQGFEVIEGVKTNRGKESFLHSISAGAFYGMMSSATGIDMRRASDFKLLDDKAVVVLLNMREKNAFFRALSSWIGFKTTCVEFEVQEREIGTSKWSIKSLIKYAINNITSFSAIPMQIVTALGGFVLAISLILGIMAIVQKIIGIAEDGFTTVIIVQLLTSSIIMICMGIIGYYIEKIYDEVKNRPRYIVSESCGGKAIDEKDN